MLDHRRKLARVRLDLQFSIDEQLASLAYEFQTSKAALARRAVKEFIDREMAKSPASDRSRTSRSANA
jgi:predicted transcriptional regulator